MTIDNLKKIDLTIIVAVIILTIIGLMNIFSTTYFPDKTASNLFINQIAYVSIGFMLVFTMFVLNYKRLNIIFIQASVFVLTIILLISVIFFGDEVLGAQRWISIGGFTIQPSEFAKIAIILITSFILSLKKPIKTTKSIKNHFLLIKILASFLVLALIVSLTALQNSLGNTILISLIWAIIVLSSFKITEPFVLLVILFFGGLLFSFTLGASHIVVSLFLFIILSSISTYLKKENKIPIFIVAAIVLLSISLKPATEFVYTDLLQDYQQQRIDAFIDPELNPQSNWNQTQAEIALGSGRVFGKGFLQGTHSNYRFLPFSFNDFAFAAIGEQFGLVGIIFVASIFMILLNRIVSIAKKTKDSFGRLICYGVSALIFVNMFQHMGMNVGILPITGVPLPFISYGGSTTLVMMIGIGLVLSVASYGERESNVTKEQLRVKK